MIKLIKECTDLNRQDRLFKVKEKFHLMNYFFNSSKIGLIFYNGGWDV